MNGFIRGVMEIGRIFRTFPCVAGWDGPVCIAFIRCHNMGSYGGVRILKRLFSPMTGQQILTNLIGTGDIHRQQCRYRRCAALKEQHRIIIAYAKQLPQIGFGLRGAIDKGFTAVADLHDRCSLALPFQQFLLGLLKTDSGKVAGPALKLLGSRH